MDNWISLGSMLPPLNPRWQEVNQGWVGSDDSFFKMVFNIVSGPEPETIKARIVLRQVLTLPNDEVIATETKTFYPNFYDNQSICFLPPFQHSGKFKFELSRYYSRYNRLIKEPSYSVEIFGARM